MATIDHLYQRAVLLSRAGKQQDARNLYAAVLEQEPGNQEIWLEYGALLGVQERRRVYQQALARVPTMPKVKRELDQINAAHPQGWRLPKWLVVLLLVLEVGGLFAFGQVILQRSRIQTLTQQTQSLQDQLIITGVQLETTQSDLKKVRGAYVALENNQKTLKGQYTAVREDAIKIRKAYLALADRNTALKKTYLDLQTRYSALTGQYNDLRVNNSELQNQYDNLTNSFNTLQANYNSLESDYNALVSRNQELENQIAYLNQTIDQLRAELASRPNFSMAGSAVTMSFHTRAGSPLNWSVTMDSLENQIIRGHEARSGLTSFFGALNWTDLEGDSGQHYAVVDFTQFVDADSVRAAAIDLYNNAPGDEAFLREAWNISRQLNVTSDVIGNDPRFPLETLMRGGGDNDDLAVLYASLIMAAQPDWDVRLVYMNTNNPNDRVEPNHLLVSINTGSGWYQVDPSGSDMDRFPKKLQGWYREIP